MTTTRTWTIALALLALCAAGCGDDGASDDSGASMDAATDSGDGDGDGWIPGRRDSGADVMPGGDGDGDGDGDVSRAQCLEQTGRAERQVCAECMCTRCPTRAAACDNACWRMVECIVEQCAGSPDDGGCITSRCTEHLPGAAAAMALGSCLVECAPICALVDGDGDAGADTDAGAD
ncbi:MAG: hypothetical protein PVI30_16900 [Myxococcales bacterium]|jgi:hypothetical protein